jgi:hypothetical protein
VRIVRFLVDFLPFARTKFTEIPFKDLPKAFEFAYREWLNSSTYDLKLLDEFSNAGNSSISFPVLDPFMLIQCDFGKWLVRSACRMRSLLINRLTEKCEYGIDRETAKLNTIEVAQTSRYVFETKFSKALNICEAIICPQICFDLSSISFVFSFEKLCKSRIQQFSTGSPFEDATLQGNFR